MDKEELDKLSAAAASVRELVASHDPSAPAASFNWGGLLTILSDVLPILTKIPVVAPYADVLQAIVSLLQTISGGSTISDLLPIIDKILKGVIPQPAPAGGGDMPTPSA